MFSQQIVQAGFKGLGAFGDESQALRGSIVDVVIYVGDSNRVFFYDAALARSLVDRLNNAGFKVINLDASNLGSLGGGGTIRARVQILSDGYGSVKDAASVVSGAASYLGYNATGFSGTLVSTPQAGPAGTQPGQQQTGQSYDPSTIPSNLPGGAAANPLTSFIDNLTKSPTMLAVILGAAVVLVIAAKK